MAQRESGRIVVIILAAAIVAGVLVLVSTMPAVRSTPVPLFIVVVGGGALVVTAIVIAVRIRRTGDRPASTHSEMAARLGLDYREKAPADFHRAIGPLPGIPGGGQVRHVMTGGLDDRPLTIFQHTYMVNTGQAVIPVHHTAYVTAAPPAWPGVTVARRALGGLLYRLGLRRGLLLDEDAFNAAMKVKTDDEDFAVTLLHPEMQRFLGGKKGITWRIHAGHAAMVYGGRLRPDRIEGSLDRMRRFWELVPPELAAW